MLFRSSRQIAVKPTMDVNGGTINIIDVESAEENVPYERIRH